MSETILIGVISALLGGGLVAGIAALLKVRPEAGQIVVTAAQGAVVVQSGVIDDLMEQLGRLREENKQLRLRVKELEAEVTLLKGGPQ